MAFTPLQNKAIEARGGNLLVSASAGSGKTTVMIARILRLLAEGESLDNMVICTFTRSAASDMRDKLQNKLIECAEAGEGYASEQLGKLSTAEISTIHSWCQRLIKTYFYALGVDPAFDIADESEANAMLSRAADAAVEEMINAQPLDPYFAEFYDIMRSKRTDAQLKRLIISVYGFITAQADPDEWLSGRAFVGYENPDLADKIVKAESARLVSRFLPAASDLLKRVTDAGFTKDIPVIESLIEQIRGAPVEVKLSGGKIPVEFTALHEEFKNLKKAYDKAANELSEYAVLPAPDNPPVYTRVLVDLVKRTKELYAEEKASKAKLDYGDLEHLTAKLVSIPEILTEIKAKYKRVFVDEYQDVNPLQERIISLVKSDDNMFLVGDIKQSIYAFRMCDPGIFLDKYLSYGKHGFEPPIELNANFRSTNEILDFCNEVFSPLMTDKFGKIDYRGSAMLIGGRGLTGGEVKLNLIACKKKESLNNGVYSVLNHEEDDTALKADAETNRIVADITEKLTETFAFDGTNRAVAPGDIAVLVSTRGKHVAMLYDKLKKAGVNVSVSDKLKFTSVHEVEVLIEFMKYLLNRTDDIALVSVLRSGLFGVTDDELADVKLSGSREEKRFYKLTEQYAESHSDVLSGKLTAFYELTERYSGYAYTMSAGELLGQLTAEKQWFPYVLSLNGGDVKADVLNSFIASACASPYGGSIGEYVEYLERGDDGLERPPASDAVSVMTIHASKGLEFPFVYIAGADKGFNLSDERGKVIADDELGLCMKNHDMVKRTVENNKLTFAAGLKTRRKLLEEKMRLLYVALTRAQFGLYIYACASEKDELFGEGGGRGFCDYEGGRSFFDWLRPVYAARGFNCYDEEDCTFTHVDETHGRLIGGKPDAKLVAAIKDYLADDYKHSHGTVKSSVTAMNEDAAEEEKPHYTTGADDDRAARRGNAYHKAMELIELTADFSSEWSRLKNIGEIGELTNEDKLKTAAEKIRRLTDGKKFYREKQFVYNYKGTLVQGVIDLIVTDGKNCTVVDYKTSKASTIQSGAYDLQLSVYARAAEDILGVKVSKTLVYSFDVSDFIETKRVPL